MRKRAVFLVLLSLFLLGGPMLGSSSADDLEKGIVKVVRDSRRIVAEATRKLEAGATATAEIAILRNIAENIRASHLLMGERLRQRTEQSAELGAKAAERHNAAATAYGKAMDDYLALIELLPSDGTVSLESLEHLKTLLDRIAPAKKRPLLGTLPYKHLGYPAREPATSPPILPAYKGGNRAVAPEDAAPSAEAPISVEIAELAQSLQWNPVLIYEWVKNNVDTEWYWGVMKGAEETLRQKSGNDADQAALLVALLRASGFPARFVKGTIEFFPDLEKVKNLTGIDDPLKIAAFFQKAGIPFKPAIAGGKIVNFQVEHIWVETFIPYSNYRGAVIDDMGKSWLGLDTSVKPHGYTRNIPLEVPLEVTASVREDYLWGLQEQTPLEYLRGKIEAYLDANQPGKGWQDVLASRTLIPDVLKIIPSSLQFKPIAFTGEYPELPMELRHQVKFSAAANGNDLFSIALDAQKLSNRKVLLTYEPETVEDQQIIDSFGGLDNTPAYLVRLRPVLMVNGERVMVAQDGLPMGGDYSLTIDVITPNGRETITSTHIAGNLCVIGIVGGKAATPAPITDSDDAEAILFKEAMSYIDRWNRAEEELAAFYQAAISRPVPTVVTVGGVIDVTYLLDMPHDFNWNGVFIDAALRGIEAVGAPNQEKEFMRLSALQGSVLEHRIFEDDLKVESVSTAKLLQLALINGAQLLTIDKKENVDALLATLPLEADIKDDITNAVNQNHVVTIPQTEITYRDWTGIGYVKENMTTGESGWMLSGMVAGGMPADLPDQWALWYLKEALSAPYTKSNKEPLSAQRILKVVAIDKQHVIVGKPAQHSLAVLVLDGVGLPVQGAPVIFKVVSGGGRFDSAGTAEEITVTTGANGVAKTPFIAGTETKSNSIYIKKVNQQDSYFTQVGVNLVTASVSGKYGTIHLNDHFQVFGWPDMPDHIEQVMGNDFTALANNPAGSVMAKVGDRYGNPISNIPLMFQALPPESKNPAVPLPATARNIQFYTSDSCTLAYPLYGECASSANITLITEYFGAMVYTILGNTVGTSYTVKVSAPAPLNLSPVLFKLSSDGYRTNGDYIPPGLFIRNLEMVNDLLQPITAAKAGTTLAAPLVSELFMLYDDYTLMQNSDGSWNLSWPGTVTVKPVKDGNVTYTATAGEGTVTPTQNLGTGKYQTKLTTGQSPAVNTIDAVGAAQVTVPQVLLSNFIPVGPPVPGFSGTPSGYNQTNTRWTVTNYPKDKVICTGKGCKLPEVVMNLYSGQQALFFSFESDGWRAAGDPEKETYTAYGVDIQLSLDPPVIPVTKNGYTKANKEFKYSILPAQYSAIHADLDFYTTDAEDGQSWIVTIAGSATQGQGSTTLVSGSHFDITKNYLAQVVLNRGSVAEIQGGKLPFQFAYGALVPDYNHNRKIEQDDIARAEKGDLYYFWVNDDDGSGDTEGTGIPGSGNRVLDHAMVGGTRDLIDWFSVNLDIGDLVSKLDPKNYTYKLKHEDGVLDFVGTGLEASHSGEYLTGSNGSVEPAQTLGSAPTVLIPSGGHVMSEYLLGDIKSGKGVIMVEAWKETTKPLVLEVADNSGKTVFSSSLYLSIAGVEQMFRHKNLVEEGGGPPPISLLNYGAADRLVEPSNFPDTETNDKHFVFVHGYNVNGEQARGWNAEMFKRMYWSGSKAKFWGVTWYGWDTQDLSIVTLPFTRNFHINVQHALKTAPAFSDFINLPVGGKNVTVAAHSLGNMLVSSAIAEQDANIQNYFLINAAVPIEAYDGTVGKPVELSVPIDSSMNQMVVWNGYKAGYLASEWYQHFESSDERSKLTWRGRFTSVKNKTQAFNFYSSGEDVLDNHMGTPYVTDIFEGTGRFSWGLQEKLKGGLPTGWMLGSNYCGWRIDQDTYKELITDAAGHTVEVALTPDAANLLALTLDDFQTRPFFKLTGDDLALLQPYPVGSDYARANRDRLLAEAIPALSLAVGRNKVAIFGLEDAYNFDMQNRFKNNGQWPPSRSYNEEDKKWKHSDLHNIAYPYIYGAYDKLKSLMELVR